MFEKVLTAESQARGRKGQGTAATFASALMGHGLLIGGMLLASALALEQVRDPEHGDIPIFFAPQPPPLATEKPKTNFRVPVKPPEPREAPKPKTEPKVEQPKPVPVQEVKVPKLKHFEQAPEVEDIGKAETTKSAPERLAAAGGSRSLAAALDAPEVKVPGGGRKGPGLPAREPGLQVGDGGTSIKAYATAGDPDMRDMTVPPPGSGVGRPGGKKGGGPVGILDAKGNGVGGGAGSGGNGIRYSGPGDAPGGEIGQFAMAGRPGGRGGGNGSGIGPGVGSGGGRLASKYGLPLVSVNSLGSRSTDAARWNMLLPRISDLLRVAVSQHVAGGATGNVLSVEQDGNTLIVRYRDGVVHVLVPTADGLAALYVARAAGARPVTSKIEEGESALDALVHLTRGAS